MNIDVYNNLVVPSSTGSFVVIFGMSIILRVLVCVCHVFASICGAFHDSENTKYNRTTILRRMAAEFLCELSYDPIGDRNNI